MNEFLQYTVLGLILGSVYGIAASGLVVTYTTSGIFNFAHGSIGMLAAFTYWQVRYDWGWPAPIALVVVIGIVAPLLGVVLQTALMRGLRGTSEITRIVVPVSVMLGFQALAVWIWNPTPKRPRSFTKFFGNTKNVDLFGIPVSYHELIAAGAAVVIAILLRFLFYKTRSGVSMRAVVDDPDLLQLNGGRPGRAAVLSWAIGASLAALGGILIVPIGNASISVNILTLLVINAFAAAMFGRLRSLPRTFVGALILGLATNYAIGYIDASRFTWKGNFVRSIPMIMLFIILLVLPQDRLRGATVGRTRERFHVPSLRLAVGWGVAFVVVIVALKAIMADSAINSLAFALTFAIIALSLVLLTGYAGEINLATMAFAGVGAVVVFHFGKTGGIGPSSRTTLWGYVLAAVVTAVVGALVSLPALRLRGLYLGLATMAFAQLVSNMVFSELGTRKVFGKEFSIFPGGSLNIPRPKFGPLDLKPMGAYMIFLSVVFSVLGVLLVVLRRSSYGRRLSAMKDSPAACATLGLNIVRLKLSVFMLSAAIAGLGGALMAAQLGAVSPDRFDIFLSLSMFMLVVVGGVGYVSGGLFGGILLGTAFAAIKNTFDKLGTDYDSFVGSFTWLATFTTVLPALMGVGMGKNPTGSVHDFIVNFGPLQKAKPVLFGGIGIGVLAYVLALAEVISNWWFVIVVILLVLFLPTVAKIVMPEAYYPPEVIRAAKAATPLELVGIERPFTDADRRRLEQALLLEPLRRRLGLRGRPSGSSSDATEPSLVAGTEAR